jgi:hypothetical protein
VATRAHPRRDQPQTLDLKPYLGNLSLVDQTLEFTLLITETGSARPAEVAALLGFDPAAINHRIRRVRILWRRNAAPKATQQTS